jgi:hypothetical protein
VDVSLVISHRQVLTGLTPGATYHYRVRSVSAAGALAISPDNIVVTTPAGSGPEIGNITVRRITGSTAAIGWATTGGAVAQVEYGPTANYGAFTLLKVFGSPSQEMQLTGLRPGTDYHFRIKAWDGTGSLGASDDATFSTASAGQATLVGDQTVHTERVTLAAGQAAAYQYVASQSGQASLIQLYVDAGTTAPVIRVALYSDRDGAPASILSQGSAPGLSPGWTSVNIPPVALVKGARYWIVALSPIGSGTLSIRDAGFGGSSSLSRQVALAAFPAVWTTGEVAARAPMSAYIQQVPPSVTLMEPADAAIVTGSVQLSAVLDDDVPPARVQFYVDGQPLGAPLTAPPYSITWDSAGFNASLPHVISARASDMLGRSGTSPTVTVQVDNGPIITGVIVSRGLTASSARVTWNTDILADAQVEFGRTTAYGESTPIDPRADWRHEAQLTGLAPGTTYHYRVRSRDGNGALAVSPDATFATAEP